MLSRSRAPTPETNTSPLPPRSRRRSDVSSIDAPRRDRVSLSNDTGVTRVALGVMAHSAFYSNVSGAPGSYQNGYAFPPPARNRFWGQNAEIALDASGHGSHTREFRSDQGTLQRRESITVAAVAGAVTVTLDTNAPPTSYPLYRETCVFTALSTP